MDLDHGTQPQSGASLASQACSSCRKQKRKCDKQLPNCGLCQRIGRPCDYTVDSQTNTPSVDDFLALRQKVNELESLLSQNATGHGHVSNGSSLGSTDTSPDKVNSLLPTEPQTWPALSSFPRMFFLDSDVFEYERFQVPTPYIKAPPGACAALGSSTELRQMIEHYFATVHGYFPVVSKIRLYQHLSNPSHEPGSDFALLFLAMKLATSEPPEGASPQTDLYSLVKSFVNYIESQNGFTIQLIQSNLLVALYEFGHGIYPASYLTIGHTARLGHAMGLHQRGAPQMLPRPTTWTEQEERRRVWWAVVILDRLVNTGNRGKPFASSDPSLDTHLPTDDSAWDRGQMLVAAPLALSASQTIKAAPYARTCQASHLLGKVIRHLNDKSLPPDYQFDEALQLHRVVRALSSVLPGEAESDDPSLRPTLCTSMGVCYSALLILYDAYSCTERHHGDTSLDTQLVMQKESIDGLAETCKQVVQMSRRIRSVIEQDGLDRVSPMIIDSIYQAAANCMCLLHHAPAIQANRSYRCVVCSRNLRASVRRATSRNEGASCDTRPPMEGRR